MSLFKITRLGLPLILAGALLLPARVARAASYTWDGCIDSNWNDARNWVPEGIPGPNDTITVGPQHPCGECDFLPCPPPPQSNLLYGSNQTVAGLNLTGGVINGSLTVSSSTVVSNWTGTINEVTSTVTIASGTRVNFDSVNLKGTVVIAPSAVVNIASLSLNGIVENSGTVNLLGNITGTSTGFFNNAGIFNLQTEGAFFNGGLFNNTGTFNKTSGTGVATFRNCHVDNSGTFNVTTGMVKFQNLWY